MWWDRFDIVEAHYLFCGDYHSGQASELYRRLSRMSRYFKPRLNLAVETLSENARAIYDALAEAEEARIRAAKVRETGRFC